MKRARTLVKKFADQWDGLWPTFETSLRPINRGNGLWYTVQYLTFAVVEAKDQASSLASLSEISTRHQTRYVPGPVSDTRNNLKSPPKVECTVIIVPTTHTITYIHTKLRTCGIFHQV